ncbi:putative transposase [Trichonephila clavipes]|nr:putative transposase [Trichonephila clavipes]
MDCANNQAYPMTLKINSIRVNRFLASKIIPVAPQPPYSPDLSPCDFFLFPKLNNHLKGHHFGTLENIQTALTDQLNAIPISEFHQCYEEWKKRLQRCGASEGSYFEGDNVDLLSTEPDEAPIMSEALGPGLMISILMHCQPQIVGIQQCLNAHCYPLSN